MAISFVDKVSAAAVTATLPATVQAGDYIVVYAYRGNQVAAPSLATGYTSLFTQASNSTACRAGYKVAVAGDAGASLGTWTNADWVIAVIYRGVSSVGAAPTSQTNVSGTTTTIPGITTFSNTNGTSWVVSFGGSNQSTSMSTPTGGTLRSSITNAGNIDMGIAFDSNAGITAWGTHTSTNGTTAVSNGGSVELVAASGGAMATFVDAFNQTTLNTALWTQTALGSSTLSYATTGATITYPASTTTSMDGELNSVSAYDLTGSSAYLRVITVTSSATSTDNLFRLRQNSTNYIDWLYESGTIYAQQVVAGTQTNLFSVAYNSTTHAYWRIRESGGTTFWDTSPDAITWTNQFSKANPITVTALTVVIAGTAFASSTSPGAFKWNNFNTTGSVAPANTGQFFPFMVM